jgi:hypothetical protein
MEYNYSLCTERFQGHIFFEFASQGNQCSAEHWQFVLNKPKCKIFSLRDVKVCFDFCLVYYLSVRSDRWWFILYAI